MHRCHICYWWGALVFVCVCIVVCKLVITEPDPNVGENSEYTFGIVAHFQVNCLLLQSEIKLHTQVSCELIDIYDNHFTNCCACACVCMCSECTHM